MNKVAAFKESKKFVKVERIPPVFQARWRVSMRNPVTNPLTTCREDYYYAYPDTQTAFRELRIEAALLLMGFSKRQVREGLEYISHYRSTILWDRFSKALTFIDPEQ